MMRPMDSVRTTWLFSPTTINNGFHFPTTLTTNIPRPFPSLRLSARSLSTDQHTTLLVETFHDHRSFKTLLKRLTRPGSSPLTLLQQDQNWTKDHFWATVRFLAQSSRASEILPIFDVWRRIEESRSNELNYNKIIKVLSQEGLMDESVLMLNDMKSRGLGLSLEVYNSVIHGFARKGEFEEALFYLDDMRDAEVAPESDTYDGLMESYAERKMYDEMGTCLTKMKLNGCPPDHVTYNLVMREFSRGGLLRRMESTYHTMISKSMHLQPSTLVAMIECYARFGILDKMEKFYTRALNTKTHLPDSLIRKLAEVYINNYMFSKLDILGVDLCRTFGETDLVWSLRLLSHSCLSSRKGMDVVIEKMEEANIPWNVTFSNIKCLMHLKMKDFTRLRTSLSQMSQVVDPDMVSVGILFDAMEMGFDGDSILEMWKREDFFYKAVEMNTDPLVAIAFGKGCFLVKCEEAYLSLEHEVREKKTWTYNNLIELVLRHKRL